MLSSIHIPFTKVGYVVKILSNWTCGCNF